MAIGTHLDDRQQTLNPGLRTSKSFPSTNVDDGFNKTNSRKSPFAAAAVQQGIGDGGLECVY